MRSNILTRRAALAGLALLPGCSAITRLNTAATPRDTYDLRAPAYAPAGPAIRRNLLVAAPDAPAVLATDRMLIRPTPQTVAYLPDARWSDDVPRLLQSLLVQTLSGTGRIGYVGTPGSGPVPDVALLLRLDRFEVEADAGQVLRAVLSFHATLLRDRDQRVIASRRFAGDTVLPNDNAATVAADFQALIGETLPAAADWVLGRMAG